MRTPNRVKNQYTGWATITRIVTAQDPGHLSIHNQIAKAPSVVASQLSMIDISLQQNTSMSVQVDGVEQNLDWKCGRQNAETEQVGGLNLMQGEALPQHLL